VYVRDVSDDGCVETKLVAVIYNQISLSIIVHKRILYSKYNRNDAREKSRSCF